jgi:uridine kinase
MRPEACCQELAERIASLQLDHPVRVAIDGVDCSGKTTLADQLCTPLRLLGRPVVRASIDSFHNPRPVRYRLGPDSPEGFYLDSYDYPLVRRVLLAPLGPGGNLHYQAAAFDVRADQPIEAAWQVADSHAILLVDGIFLLRPELLGCWDFRIFLSVQFNTVLERAARRDLPLFRDADAVRAQYLQRYIPGQQIYLRTCRPQDCADLVIDNNDFLNPLIISARPQ